MGHILIPIYKDRIFQENFLENKEWFIMVQLQYLVMVLTPIRFLRFVKENLEMAQPETQLIISVKSHFTT